MAYLRYHHFILLPSHVCNLFFDRCPSKATTKAFLATPSPLPMLPPEILSSSEDELEELQSILRKPRLRSKLKKRDFLQDAHNKPHLHKTWFRMSEKTLDKLMDVIGNITFKSEKE